MERQLNQTPMRRWRANHVSLALVVGLTLGTLGPHELRAVGFRLPNQDPEAIARGNAFVATANNPSAIYYNPAGITQLEGQQMHGGLYVISADTEYTSPSGTKAKTDSSLQAVPQFYYVNSLKKLPISLGVGVYAPYGLSLDWGNNNPFRTVAESGSLLYACINPVIAWRVHPTFSVAVGPTINYSQATLKQGIAAPGDEFKFDGDGIDCGFNAGLRWQPGPMWALGCNYRSATTVNYDGHSEFYPYYPRTATSAELLFPQFVVGGVSFRPTPDWNLEFDLDWTDWDSVKQAVFRGTALGDIPLIFNYHSSLMYEFGCTWQPTKGFFISVGYIYSENSSPDQNFNPLIPDADLHLGSVGFGYSGKKWDWAIGYHFAYNPERVVSNDANAPANGTYKTFNNAFNVSATFKF